MKLVKEHINFQRGLDPKRAMGTGLSFDAAKYPEIINNVAEILKNDIHLKDIEIIKANGIEYKIRFNDGKNGYAFFHSITRNGFIVTTSWSEKTFYVDSLGELYKVIERKVNEKMNFERGIDPKDAMQTGEYKRRMREKLPPLNTELQKFLDEKDITDIFLDNIVTELNAGKKLPKDPFLNTLDLSRSCIDQGFVWVNTPEGSKFWDNINREWDQFIWRKFKGNISNESINFQRGLDPKEAMGIGVGFKTLKAGDILRVKKVTEFAQGGRIKALNPRGNLPYVAQGDFILILKEWHYEDMPKGDLYNKFRNQFAYALGNTIYDLKHNIKERRLFAWVKYKTIEECAENFDFARSHVSLASNNIIFISEKEFNSRFEKV